MSPVTETDMICERRHAPPTSAECVTVHSSTMFATNIEPQEWVPSTAVKQNLYNLYLKNFLFWY